MSVKVSSRWVDCVVFLNAGNLIGCRMCYILFVSWSGVGIIHKLVISWLCILVNGLQDVYPGKAVQLDLRMALPLFIYSLDCIPDA